MPTAIVLCGQCDQTNKEKMKLQLDEVMEVCSSVAASDWMTLIPAVFDKIDKTR